MFDRLVLERDIRPVLSLVLPLSFPGAGPPDPLFSLLFSLILVLVLQSQFHHWPLVFVVLRSMCSFMREGGPAATPPTSARRNACQVVSVFEGGISPENGLAPLSFSQFTFIFSSYLHVCPPLFLETLVRPSEIFSK